MMGAKSKIEWCDATWNPILGCRKCASGCRNCFAVGQVHRMSRNPNPKIRNACEDLVREGDWTGEVRFLRSRISIPLKWTRPREIFVCSLSDLFHPAVENEWLDQILLSIRAATERNGHKFIILTKRPARMARMMLDSAPTFPNVWLGFSASTQRDLNTGGPFLMELAAAGWKTFLSLEPLCEAISLPMLASAHAPNGVIVGGESGSGPDIRPMHPDYPRSIRDQCKAAGVPFCFKQWGKWAPGEMAPGPITRTERCAWWFNDEWDFGSVTPATIDAHWTDPPDVFRMDKKRAGRLLDGELHDELPWRRP